MPINYFGQIDGIKIKEASLENSNNSVSIISYGAITRKWVVRHKGKEIPVVLGFDSLCAYQGDTKYIGIIAGRVANRTQNGLFRLKGIDYQLERNDFPNHLHGGSLGFGKRNWDMELDSQKRSVRLKRVSSHMEAGYPGKVVVTICITLLGNSLLYEMVAKPDRPTAINLAQHNYYNLLGKGEIWSHSFATIATCYTPVDDHLIPTGEVKNLKDLCNGLSLIGYHDASSVISIRRLDPGKNGIDVNFALPTSLSVHEPAAVMMAENGLQLQVFTDQPGLQFYTGRGLSSKAIGHNGVSYKPFTGFCLEPQSYPSSLTVSSFPSIIYTPEKPYTQKTMIRLCSSLSV